MKIAYASDLHLEFDSSLTLTGLSTADVLVLAGDVDTMPEYYAEFLRKLRLAYAGPVIFVLGNHEYYNGIFPDDRQKYREAIAQDRQAFLLENQSVIMDGVCFLGATLWTDFASGRQMRSCRRMMSDFDVIFDGASALQGIGTPYGHSENITPEAIFQVHQDNIAWLDDQFTRSLQGANPWQGPTVVVTHHAPSFQSQHPRFAGSPISGGFCSNQEHRIQRWQPNVWIHGHVHDPMDYRIGKTPLQGATRVLCNPWGYPDEGRAREYRMVEMNAASKGESYA
ncbi:MAG: metallophosphoesterase [Acidithiobacillus ferrooxidans]|nr:metallophosphoesterase [Acidithiobacillus ferrooxidans]MDD5003502.1 metallophosphoesterase [Acidithiobacillus sp.]MDD5378367.1 metallophosphoesterase [Acidithiobacillus sp.]MDD5576262.1 metallophosphoesterase [Acidithiobacillus sp.]